MLSIQRGISKGSVPKLTTAFTQCEIPNASCVVKFSSSCRICLSGEKDGTVLRRITVTDPYTSMLNKGLDLDKAGDHVEAMALYKEVCQGGSQLAKYNMGHCLMIGAVGKQDRNTGVAWWKTAGIIDPSN